MSQPIPFEPDNIAQLQREFYLNYNNAVKVRDYILTLLQREMETIVEQCKRATPAEGLVPLDEEECAKEMYRTHNRNRLCGNWELEQEFIKNNFRSDAKAICKRFGTHKQEPLTSVNGLLEALDFAKAAIGDAIYCEDGLDGSAGEAMIKMIDGAVKNYKESKPQGIGVDYDKMEEILDESDVITGCIYTSDEIIKEFKSRQNEWLINNPNHGERG